MGLFLIETTFNGEAPSKETIEEKVTQIQTNVDAVDASLIEVQISKDHTHAFFIVESANEADATAAIEQADITVTLQKEVRLIGEQLEDVKQKKDVVNYLVEWNLPENLTMDQYLARKQKNSVHYEEVPEVSFARTYVCEDMTKCLCFYDAPDQAAVEKAREAVQAPIDAITELD